MSVTVYGCVKLSDGTVTFENLETCLEQSACIITGGEHAWQVALTLSGADDENCNDTFYGCVNLTTGKFQVEIPDDCCEEYSPYLCEECPIPDETPFQAKVTFSEVQLCTGCMGQSGWSHMFDFGDINVNTEWLVKNTYEDDCKWHRKIYDKVIERKWNNSSCSGDPVEILYPAFDVMVLRGNDFIIPRINVGDIASVFYAVTPVDSNCLNKNSVNNVYSGCTWYSAGFGGSVKIEEFVSPCDDAPAYSPAVHYEFGNYVIHYEAPYEICYLCITPHGPAPDDHAPPNPIYWVQI